MVGNHGTKCAPGIARSSSQNVRFARIRGSGMRRGSGPSCKNRAIAASLRARLQEREIGL